jgi:hypothetical protein
MGIENKDTLSGIFVKNIDYGSEEWIKQTLQNVIPKKLNNVIPYIGVVKFPSNDFYDNTYNYKKNIQFQNSIYFGYMDMLLPKVKADVNTQTAYTRLTFLLDGVRREFVQISNGDIQDGAGKKFFDFVKVMFPKASSDVVFNRNAMHYLTDFEVTAATYDPVLTGAGFTQTATGSAAFISSFEFEVLISGYKCIML